MNIANTILNQIGGNRFAVMTGSKNFIALENALSMKLTKNNSKANYLKITLDGSDTYTMTFTKFTDAKFNMKTGTFKDSKTEIVKEIGFVYADQLEEIFTSVTGLYTRL